MSLMSVSGKFIYVRVPRTASTTHKNELARDYPDIEQIGRPHASAWETCLTGSWDLFHTYGYIRNPWEWLVSIYNSGVSETAGPPEKWQGTAGDNPMIRGNMSFDEWVRQRKTTPLDWLVDDKQAIIVDDVRLFEDYIKGEHELRSDVARAPYPEWYDDSLAAYVADRCSVEILIGNYTFGS